MKSVKYLLFFVFALTITLSSCKKKDEVVKTKKELLTSNQWKLSSYKDNGVAVFLHDCEKDNFMTFATTGTFTYNPGTIKCNTNETILTYSWTLSSDEKSITADGTVLTILDLTESKFVYTSGVGTDKIEFTYIAF